MTLTNKALNKLRGKISKLSAKHSKKIAGSFKIKKHFENKIGLEIGGPSEIFSDKGYIPVYPIANTIDGCNFSNNTVWENTITEGLNYKYGDSVLGYQYIKDATDLSGIDSEKYDFLLSSHSLEHIANPIKAIKEWIRVLKKDGVLLLILPDKNYTFDHRRPITKFEHLLDDYHQDITEHDLTHLEEILSLHDLTLDLPAGDASQFRSRSLENYNNRCLHQHVFDFKLLDQIFKYFNLKVIVKKATGPLHLIIMGQKR
ncbi:MAG: methyltransferase domain-containing protein [Mucilaginibacter sp.]|nr:methyltransferase domain-containing protein [Mucilaginibacter sp.]